MTIRLVVIALTLAARTAAAGPYCGTQTDTAPADGTVLPVRPTITLVAEDSYYDGDRQAKATALGIRATIDGKPVTFATRDVRTKDGLLRFLTIRSDKTGKLVITAKQRYGEVETTFTISKDWKAPETVGVTLVRGRDTRLGPYRRIGELAILRADAPVIAFSLRWRRDHDDEWRVLPLPASTQDGKSEARLGQTMCGMVENVPLKFLEAGIEAELTAWLPNGKTVEISLPTPLVIPPSSE